MSPLRRPLAAAIALAPLLGLACASTPEGLDEEQQLRIYRETAYYHYENEDIARAESQALKGLAIDPDDRSLMRMVGWIQLQRGRSENLLNAEGIFEKLLETDGGFQSVLGLANADERLGQAYAEAARDVASGAREPRAGADAAAEAERLRAIAREKWFRAIDLYHRCLGIEPTAVKAMTGLQRTHGHLGNDLAALAWARRTIELTRSEMRFYRRQLARASVDAADEERLREDEIAAVDLLVETELYSAALLRRIGRDEAALERLDAALEIDPSQATTYSRRGQLHMALGNWAAAQSDLDAFLQMSDLPFEHSDVQRAFRLKDECARELARARLSAES